MRRTIELKGWKCSTHERQVAVIEVKSFRDTQAKVNANALDYQMADRKAEVKMNKLGDTSQRQKMMHW